jgi:hypothetical protein
MDVANKSVIFRIVMFIIFSVSLVLLVAVMGIVLLYDKFKELFRG